MALPEPTRSQAVEYARKDLPGDVTWHVDYFDFISDIKLRERIGQEFYAARNLYKFWEGLRIDEDWAKQAQIQLQVQQYASIYEASIHHLLFVEAAETPQVQQLFEYQALVQRDLPVHIMNRIRDMKTDDSDDIVGAVKTTKRTQVTKIRFDKKVTAAVALGIIAMDLGDEITSFYTARNYIHIHAELSQPDLEWQISFARDAYLRLQPFKDQATSWLAQRKS
ncbi:hypothetical protein [Glutamicibacter sp. 0426]|uniref:hypothetical protein n=1 Tax=Glutamicibacter sp. 0426 TaxID=1913445 RepID=UPI000939244D|nr:hypothetical protein [Glutamicibacter sp. 0426]